MKNASKLKEFLIGVPVQVSYMSWHIGVQYTESHYLYVLFQGTCLPKISQHIHIVRLGSETYNKLIGLVVCFGRV